MTAGTALPHIDRAAFEAGLAALHARLGDEVSGVFGPDSAAWLIFREVAILPAGLSAVLLQIAHPAVAAGVNGNSRFRSDVPGRGHRTATTMYQLVFGDWQTAAGAATRLHLAHARVRGTVAKEDSAARAGQAFRANDPALLLWVHTTLFYAAVQMYERLVRRLTADEWARYSAEGRLALQLLGVPSTALPPTAADLDAYYQHMLMGDVLDVGSTARELARILFESPYTPRWLVSPLTAGLLTPRWREAFGLRWTARDEREFDRLIALMRRTVRLSPPVLRFCPAYHQALVRVRRHQQERIPFVSHIIARTMRAAPWPLRLVSLP
jgi:uncharacterized protein (DUF2236 family)